MAKDDDFELDDFYYTVFDLYGDVVIRHELEHCPRWVRRLLQEILGYLAASIECDIDMEVR